MSLSQIETERLIEAVQQLKRVQERLDDIEEDLEWLKNRMDYMPVSQLSERVEALEAQLDGKTRRYDLAAEDLVRAEMTAEQQEEQRRSFVYGNLRIDNESMTREIVDRVADEVTVRTEVGGEEMSLYNVLFGKNSASDIILATLGLTRDDVGRFRDCYVSNGEIAVYTRNGGSNRECWNDETPEDGECSCHGCIISNQLPQHPCYLRDEDDDFDCTYATIYFRFPEEFAEGLRAMDSGVKWDPDERWQKMLDAVGKFGVKS